jgi:type III secretory pathway component EscS
MNVMLPHHKSHVFLLGLFLIDLPVLIAVVVVGFFYGFIHTYNEVMEWRLAHLWSMIPSVVLSLWLIRKWWKA